jgi:hypothetical protein
MLGTCHGSSGRRENVYWTIVSHFLTKIADEDAVNEDIYMLISHYYRKACVCAAAYSHIFASAVVDKTMDIIETVFLKEGMIGDWSCIWW